MDPQAVVARINALAAIRSDVCKSESVSHFEVEEAEIRTAHALFEADKAVPPFWREKYARELVKNWDLFYKRNKTNFFKDRLWLQKEFGELTGDDDDANENLLEDEELDNETRLVVEIGCGVGNALIPLLFRNPKLTAIGLDCSRQAIDLLNDRWRTIESNDGPWLQPRTGPARQPILDECAAVQALGNHSSAAGDAANDYAWPGGKLLGTGVCDITQGPVPDTLCTAQNADFVLLLFVLSAIPPAKIEEAARNSAKLLKPGGLLLFRDYARYDMAQIRFAKSKRALVEDNFYVRQDGTLAYFFLAEEVRRIFVDICGLEEVDLSYFLREFKNRKTGCKMKRIWIQAKFRAPSV